MSPREVAELLGACEHTVYRMFRRGELAGYRVGRKIRFLRSTVEAHMNGAQR